MKPKGESPILEIERDSDDGIGKRWDLTVKISSHRAEKEEVVMRKRVIEISERRRRRRKQQNKRKRLGEAVVQ